MGLSDKGKNLNAAGKVREGAMASIVFLFFDKDSATFLSIAKTKLLFALLFPHPMARSKKKLKQAYSEK